MSDSLAAATRMARQAGDGWGWGYIDPFVNHGKSISDQYPHAKKNRSKRKAERKAKRQAQKKNKNS